MSLMLNYIAIAVFLSFCIIILVGRLKKQCYIKKSDEKYQKLSSSKSPLTKEDKDFLNTNVYQNTNLIDYNMLVNYPSWGEWSWGNNGNSKGYSNYSILDCNNSPNKRGINN